MAIVFFKAPPEGQVSLPWPAAPAEGEEAPFTLFALDRAGDPDGNALGYDWLGALGEEEAINAWAADLPIEEVPAAALPNPLGHYPDALLEALPPRRLPPDYISFWDALLVSPVYQEIRQQALQSPGVLVACTEFIAAFTDAKNGRPNVDAVQACIDNLFAAGSFSPEDFEAMLDLLAVGHLDGLFVLPTISN